MSAQEIQPLEEQCRKNPDDAGALLRLAQGYEQQGSLGKALLAYAKAVEYDWSPSAWAEFHLRFYAQAVESVRRILKALEEEVRRNPGSEAHAYLACGYAKTNQVGAALSEFERAQKGADRREELPEHLRHGYLAVATCVLTDALGNQLEWVRRHAALVLADLGDKSGTPVLVKALKEENWLSRENAAMALAELGHRSGMTALTDALKDQNPEVRKDAAKALLKVGDQSTVPALVEALKDHNPNVRMDAAIALTRLGDPSSFPALREALRDENWTVRVYAAQALVRLGEASGKDFLAMAEACDHEAEHLFLQLVQVLEPLIILGLGLTIGLIVKSVFIPFGVPVH